MLVTLEILLRGTLACQVRKEETKGEERREQTRKDKKSEEEEKKRKARKGT